MLRIGAILIFFLSQITSPGNVLAMGKSPSEIEKENIFPEPGPEDFLQLLKIAPTFKKNTITSTKAIWDLVYAAKLKDRIILNKNWKQIPRDKIYFDSEKEKFETWRREKALGDENPDMRAGVVLGKIHLSSKYWGLLILESGFYSLTSIELYPISKTGVPMAGLEVADYFGDAGEERTISSEIHGSKLIVTVHFIGSATESSAANAKVLVVEGQRTRDERKTFQWVFDETKGFVEKKPH